MEEEPRYLQGYEEKYTKAAADLYSKNFPNVQRKETSNWFIRRAII